MCINLIYDSNVHILMNVPSYGPLSSYRRNRGRVYGWCIVQIPQWCEGSLPPVWSSLGWWRPEELHVLPFPQRCYTPPPVSENEKRQYANGYICFLKLRYVKSQLQNKEGIFNMKLFVSNWRRPVMYIWDVWINDIFWWTVPLRLTTDFANEVVYYVP